MPSLDAFIIVLTREKDKLVHMGAVKIKKANALATNQGNKNTYKEKRKR